MPLTETGNKVLGKMRQEYGSKKGEQVFYASINKGNEGTGQWHKSKKLGKM